MRSQTQNVHTLIWKCCCFVVVGILSSSLLPYCCCFFFFSLSLSLSITMSPYLIARTGIEYMLKSLWLFYCVFFCFGYTAAPLCSLCLCSPSLSSYISANAYNFCSLSTQIAIHVSHSFASNTLQANRCFFNVHFLHIFHIVSRILFSFFSSFLNISLLLVRFFHFFFSSKFLWLFCTVVYIQHYVHSTVACVPFEII